jgi:hypothetical protein
MSGGFYTVNKSIKSAEWYSELGIIVYVFPESNTRLMDVSDRWRETGKCGNNVTRTEKLENWIHQIRIYRKWIRNRI